MSKELKDFAVELFKIGAVKFGNFKTNEGLATPIDFDLGVLVSYPKLMETLASFIIVLNKRLGKFDMLCGATFTAMAMASVASIKTGVRLVMHKEGANIYGTKGLIEGYIESGDEALIIDDVVTTGDHILEMIKDMNKRTICVPDVFAVINFEQGCEARLNEKRIKMGSLFTVTQLVWYLKEANCIDENTFYKVTNYLDKTKITSKISNVQNRLRLTYSDRAQHSKNKVASRLFKLMNEKRSNLCVAADLTKAIDILNLAEQVGPHICLLKTHIDIVEDFHMDFLKDLKDVAKRHNFILFEDRKFADIRKLVKMQCSNGVYKISSWADLVTVHSLAGKDVLDALKRAGSDDFGVFLIAEMSAAGNFDRKYAKLTLKLAEQCSDIVMGIVCQTPLFLDNPGLVQLTPGVRLDKSSDDLGQQYNTPEYAILKQGADVAVVGRGITESPKPKVAAMKYQELLWNAYSKRINQ